MRWRQHSRHEVTPASELIGLAGVIASLVVGLVGLVVGHIARPGNLFRELLHYGSLPIPSAVRGSLVGGLIYLAGLVAYQLGGGVTGRPPPPSSALPSF